MGALSCWSFLWDIIHNEKHLSTVIETEGCQRIESRICDLPDDLLLWILHHVPTKDAVATSILSKRWRYVWTMLPILEFKDDGSESVGWFTENSLQLHKAPKLYSLIVEVGPHCPVDVNVGKWVENAVHRGVEVLEFKLLWTAQPTSFPKCLYTCDTLVYLILSNQILVDVTFPARLPSLLDLTLKYVVYKDEDSLLKLLSSSPVLKGLMVSRREDDNLKNFTVKVSSLETLFYDGTYLKNEVEDNEVDEVGDNEVDEVEDNEVDELGDNEVEVDEEEEDEVEDVQDLNGRLMIESPSLTKLDLLAVRDYCLIENMSCLDNAYISSVPNHDEKFLRSLSSVIHLHLFFTKAMVACCNAIKFSRLIEFYFRPDNLVDWLEPLMFLLQNSPKLKTLTIDTQNSYRPLSWNQSSSISGCLLSHLEILRWRGYGGRECKKQVLDCILANSKCLKTVEISLLATCNLEETQKELESTPRISTSSQLLISTQMAWRFNGITTDE